MISSGTVACFRHLNYTFTPCRDKLMVFEIFFVIALQPLQIIVLKWLRAYFKIIITMAI